MFGMIWEALTEKYSGWPTMKGFGFETEEWSFEKVESEKIESLQLIGVEEKFEISPSREFESDALAIAAVGINRQPAIL